MSESINVGDRYGASEPRKLIKKEEGNDSSSNGKWMDEQRSQLVAYEYLCHLQEAKQWMEACIKTDLPATIDLEEHLRNGVSLCKLAQFFAPEGSKPKKPYDADLEVYNSQGLKFRHTDNINHWFNGMQAVGLPKLFYPTTTDLYDKKNLPKVIYCIHALSHFLYRKGIAPKIQDLVGKAQFTEEEISAMNKALGEYGIEMPHFGKIGGILAKEMTGDDAALHAAIIAINEAIEKGDADNTYTAMDNGAARLENLDDQGKGDYQDALFAAKHKKSVRFDIKISKSRSASVEGLDTIGTEEQVAAVTAEVEANSDIYDKYLTRDEIQTAIDQVNFERAIAAINAAVDSQQTSQLEPALKNPVAQIVKINSSYTSDYLAALTEAKAKKKSGGVAGSGATVVAVSVTSPADNGDSASTADADAAAAPAQVDGESASSASGLSSSSLTKDEIQSVVSSVNQKREREDYLKANEGKIVLSQALIRGFLERKKFQARHQHFKDNVDKIIKIQAWWRGVLQRRKYLERLKFLNSQTAAALKIQSWVRGYQQRKRYRRRMAYLKDNSKAAIKIQAAWRGMQARRDFKNFTKKDDVAPATIKKFLHLLDQSELDFSEELELQRLKAKVVLSIRDNQQLEKELNVMDIKIGLLVKNAIGLDDVVKQSRKIRKRNFAELQQSSQQGLKVLSKENRSRLESYQHLFYLLQTKPHYFAKLIYVMPQSKTSKFMENVIFTVYNFAQNARDEYLLLQLFHQAIIEEMERVAELSDFVKGNPTVVKLVVQYNRGARERLFLRELLQPLIKEVLDNPDLNLNTSPVAIYKAWINKMENDTGKATELPYDVSNEQALEHEFVRNTFEHHLEQLKTITNKFQLAIVGALQQLPYGIRYIAMKLREVLRKKFADLPDEEIIKVVGNMIYYRYMNPAIVAPDAFDVVDISVQELLSTNQRRNLGEVAKMLQFMASKTTFKDSYQYLAVLNPFMLKGYEVFRKFFELASTVEEAAQHFIIDEYSDITMRSKPAIYISVKEIYSTHTLLQNNLDDVASSDPEDPLRIIMKELGPAPEIPDLITAEEGSAAQAAAQAVEAAGDISLTLNNRFALPEGDDSDVRALFVRTKRLVVNIVRCQPGKSLSSILNTPASKEQEQMHQDYMVAVKTQNDRLQSAETDEEKNRRSTVIKDMDVGLSLEDTKKKVLSHIATLEKENLVSSANDYQDLLNAIARDIRNQHAYRKQRKAEISKLRKTVSTLEEKTSYFEKQTESYNEYIKHCMENMAKGVKPRRKTLRSLFTSKKVDEKHQFGSYSYSAKTLKERGILIDIEGVPESSLSTVKLTIASNEVGVFDISASFLGVKQDDMELHLDELLQMQYDGIAVMKIFNAKINVNLLIFLLNKKFYGNTKK